MSAIEEFAESVAGQTAEILKEQDGTDVEIVDVEFVKEGKDYFLRVYIDKPGGMDLDVCEKFSRIMNDILDQKDYIQEEYIFEVSSPGLTRPLKKEKDYLRAIGRKIEIKLFEPVTITDAAGKEVSSKQFEAYLDVVEPDFIEVSLESSAQNEEKIKLMRKSIALARLAYVEE